MEKVFGILRGTCGTKRFSDNKRLKTDLVHDMVQGWYIFGTFLFSLSIDSVTRVYGIKKVGTIYFRVQKEGHRRKKE